MGIILKFAFRNIFEKKMRTFLIIFSIILSTALFFGSISITGTLKNMYVEQMRKYYGTADIIIHSIRTSPSGFFSAQKCGSLRNEMSYIVGAVQSNAIYKFSKDEVVRINLQGFALEELQQMNTLMLTQQSELRPFSDHKLIINAYTASKYGLKLNDIIDLEIRKQRYKFRISAIAEAVGPFQEDGRTTTAVVPRETLASIFGAQHLVTTIYMKPKDQAKEQQHIEILSSMYKRYRVAETITDEDMKSYTDRITSSFFMMGTIVFFMSIFIIYTSFKVITRERLPVIGAFRSVGATKKMTDIVLLAESILYGIIGGAIGCLLGLAILYAMAVMSAPSWMGKMDIALEYSLLQLLEAFLMALTLSVVSSVIPIIKVSKLPVKDIVLNKIEAKTKRKKWKLYLALLFLPSAFVVPPFLPGKLALPAGTVVLLLSVAGVIMVIPYLMHFFVWVFERIYTLTFGNIGVLAAKNLRDNKSIINSTALIAIGIASILMIKTAGVSVLTELSDFFGKWNFEVYTSPQMADRNYEKRFRSIEGVTDTYGVFGYYEGIPVAGTDVKLNSVDGVDKKFFDYFKHDIPGGPEAYLSTLEAERSIIMTSKIRDKLHVKLGDSITLETKKGDRSYKVIGFFESLENNGDYALIGVKYLKSDMQVRYYSAICVRVDGDPDLVQQSIRSKFVREQFWNETVKGIRGRNIAQNERMFVIMDGFSLMAMIIGIFGVLNNLLLSFLERKQSLAVLRSMGISQGQIIRMILIESMTTGLIGGIMGVFAGWLMISVIPYVTRSMGLNGNMIYSTSMFALALAAGMVITITASISPAMKSSRLNIIESIKYE